MKVWVQHELQATVLQNDVLSMGTFLFLIRYFLGHQGSLWTLLQAVASFQPWLSSGVQKIKISHIRLVFSNLKFCSIALLEKQER